MLVFVSYSRLDREFALRLVERLRAWGYDTWLDIQNIPKGAHWPDEIDKGLEAADVVVGVLSENSMTSGNVKNEWDWALEYDKPLLPVRLMPCKISHRYIRINYIDCAQNEVAGFDQLRAALKSPQTTLREALPDGEATPAPTKTKAMHEVRGVDNRARILQKVYDFWIEGVLEPSEIGDVWLDLPAEQRPETIQLEIKRDLRHPDFDTFTLGSGIPIGDVFHRLGRELLILGAPGSGKTMTLLELTRDLITRAQADSSLPIPVVLNLASWAEQSPENLEDWLVERLFREYGVPRKLAVQWIANGKLLFLLDGLDEVLLDRRDACVTVVNAFWQRYDQVDNGIAVCSRIADYELLTERLHLENAIQLRPLMPGQADAYLERLGTAWDDLRAALPTDPVLREMSESPLLLNIMAVAYRDTPREQIIGLIEEDQRRQVFKQYVDRCLHEGPAHMKYTHVQTRHYLAWLARKLVEHEQIVLQIERLQPRWMDMKGQWKRYRWDMSIASGLICALIFGLFVGFVVGLFFGRDTGMVSGLIGGMMWRSAIQKAEIDKIELVERLSFSWQDVLRGLALSLLLVMLVLQMPDVLVVVLAIVLVVVLLVLQFKGLVGVLFVVLAVVLLVVLVSVLIFGLTSEAVEQRLRPNQGIRRSLSSGLIGGLVGALVGGLVGVLMGGLVSVLVGGLVSVLFLGLVGGLVGGPVLGLRNGGFAVLQHVVLRSVLYRFGVAPLNYAEFLRYTSSRHLTRQVGGGYMFRHRMLMEHFAKSDW